MNGEMLCVWPRSWQEIWLRLSKWSMTPDDLFTELVRELATPPVRPDSPPQPSKNAYDSLGNLVDQAALGARANYELSLEKYVKARSDYEVAVSSEGKAKVFFKKLLQAVATETQAVKFLETAHSTLEAYGEANLTARFRALVADFIVGFSLRYELRGNFSLHATIPGVFSKLITEVKKLTINDPHLSDLLLEFEEAFGDLKTNRTQAKMKSSLQKQFNLLEALGQKCPGVSETTLGAICNQLDWPHATVREVGKKLYGFRSSYPGLGHGGSAKGALRKLDMRDFVSLSLMLASLTPYLANGLDSDLCYTA